MPAGVLMPRASRSIAAAEAGNPLPVLTFELPMLIVPGHGQAAQRWRALIDVGVVVVSAERRPGQLRAGVRPSSKCGDKRVVLAHHAGGRVTG
jgi:hypothetical protein